MRYVFSLILLFTLSGLQSQVSIWFDKSEADMRRAQDRVIVPDVYRTVGLNLPALRARLDLAPHETGTPPTQSPVILEVPTPDGTYERFRIVHYDMMEEGLSSRYPEVKTFRGVHVDNPWRTIRFDWTARGFSAMISGGGARYFIDPYAKRNQSDYISYYKSDYSGSGATFECFVESDPVRPEDRPPQRVSGDCTFRSYRLAVATTGEYSNFHDAFSAADSDTVLAAVVIAINRVNEVYERDVAIRLILIANTDDVFYYVPGTDPYSGTACNMLSQNQTTLDNVIGSANYDIGHVFTAVGGGCASLNVPCTGNKARGA
ncbi:MAG: zinc-dependent metalloprotease family protein, partial [Saprospiraceae bacterium]|nr:zinc-dependent metalloprotease family protein [Saprospiraceae bacterium]